MNRIPSKSLAAAAFTALLLAACSNPFSQAPAETPALSFAEPLDCTYGSDSCTLLVSDGTLELSGTTNGSVAQMSYTVNEGETQLVPLTGDTFDVTVPGLNEGGNVITINLEGLDGQTVVVVVVVVNNPGANAFAPDEMTVYVSNNGSDNAGNIDVFNERFELQSVFMGGNNEGLEVDSAGNVYQAGDSERGPSIRIISQLYTRENLAFDADSDREISGNATGLVAPKGLELAEDAGLIIAADFGDSNIKVFNTSDDGNTSPVATTGLEVAPWDVVYDPTADRLFAALTDGTVGVFDGYLNDSDDGFGSNGPDRIITPARDDNQISDNLHGIAYDFDSDTLVVSDVGAATTPEQPGFKNDGSLYVLENASTADGNATPRRVVEGRWTLLGNPVDLILNGDEVRVAEKAGDFLLVFDNIFDPNSETLGDEVMPDLVKAEIKPEALVGAPVDFTDPGTTPTQNPDVTDIDDPNIAIDALFATSNVPDAGNDFVVSVEPDLSGTLSAFDTTGATVNPENLTFGGNGDGFLTFDDGKTPSQGGLLVIDRLAAGRDAFAADSDRIITGDRTGLVGPKGLDVAGSLNTAIVADFGAQDIKVFSTAADGNIAPLYVTDDLGNDMRSVWDLDYEPSNDTLYVAATDGAVLVYEGYSSSYGANGPDRVLTPTKAGDKVSANLHGIVYVADKDALILADVGAATTPEQDGFNSDGQLLTLENLGDADGELAVTARIRGPNTTLGNPVDLTFSGATFYIAEKTQDTVITYDAEQVLDRPGDWNIAPSSSITVDNVESVALAPDFLN